MQTFLPHADFRRCANVLDTKRLGKQRVEALQILNAIALRNKGLKGGWVNHPVVIMWQDYIFALRFYMNCMIEEWISRGYKNTILLANVGRGYILPDWCGDNRLHSSHRAALLIKNPSWYSQFGWTEQPKTEYFWPSKCEDYMRGS